MLHDVTIRQHLMLEVMLTSVSLMPANKYTNQKFRMYLQRHKLEFRRDMSCTMSPACARPCPLGITSVSIRDHVKYFHGHSEAVFRVLRTSYTTEKLLLN